MTVSAHAHPATVPGTSPGGDTLTLRIFRALYRDFDLHTIGGADIACGCRESCHCR
jgi:hypothetical protein